MISSQAKLFFNNFEQLKREAYSVAKLGILQGQDEKWRYENIERFPENPMRKVWSDTINLYLAYLIGELTLEDAKAASLEIGEIYPLSRMYLFKTFMNQVFEDKGIRHGNVTFECPLCGGEAFGQIHHTPNNISHTTSFRCGCTKCGIRMMN